MANSPPPGAFDPQRALLDRIAALEASVKNLTNKTLFSVSVGSGGITINNGGGITVNGGTIVIGPGGSIQLPAGGTITDALGNIIFSADALTGQRLSTPFLSVPMIPKWAGGTFQSNTSVGDYSIAASVVTSETVLWSGSIPQALHPKIQWLGATGRITGSTSIPTYRLYVNLVKVGTWSQTTYGNFTTPQFDITGVPGVGFGFQNVSVTVSIQADVTSTDNLAFTTTSVLMCGD